ncbi:hypothetical protein NC651_003335 [Populus alba x Populus x berolinensis]|nr:hypothetical protein NC651_003335 [Populus alba x Populus x berolinensis]
MARSERDGGPRSADIRDPSHGVDDEVTVDIDSLISCVESMMSQNLIMPDKVCIFRVPHILRRHSEKAYTPNAFSIGPWHRHHPLMKSTEKVKLKYLKGLLSRRSASITLKELIKSTRGIENEARSCYAGPIDVGVEDFVRMLVIDGCFLIELFRKDHENQLREDDDPIFKMSCMLQYLYHDLILVENQIPWFVLEHLFRMTAEPGNATTLAQLALQFFQNIFSSNPPTIVPPYQGQKHLLDLLRNWLVLSSGEEEDVGADVEDKSAFGTVRIMGFPDKLCDSLNMKLLGVALLCFCLDDTTEQDINMSYRFHLRTVLVVRPSISRANSDSALPRVSSESPLLVNYFATEAPRKALLLALTFLGNLDVGKLHSVRYERSLMLIYVLLQYLTPQLVSFIGPSGCSFGKIARKDKFTQPGRIWKETMARSERDGCTRSADICGPSHEVDDQVTVDIDSLTSSVGSKMSQNLIMPDKVCIFRVPQILRRHSEEAYTPNAFSIGPWHRHHPLMKSTEKIKLKYLKGLLSRRSASITLKELIKSTTGIEKEARSCYAGPIHVGVEDFVEILVTDGCFLIELFRKDKYNHLREDDDPIFNMSCMLQYLNHDLILVENQIPWLVLERLFRMTAEPGNTTTLAQLALHFFQNIFSSNLPPIVPSNQGPKHLLDLLRNWLFLSSGKEDDASLASLVNA